jgi:phenylalanyl-tRNA synthetase beta chain
MRVSLKWLKDLVDVTLPVEQLCDRLDMTGTKVGAVHTLGEALEGVVVGQVLAKEQHPDADKLSYCQVDVGGGEPLNIVCGAQNFNAGGKVPVACVGATLPGGLTIKRAKLRGLESQGMMCSATELQVGGDASGLLILPADAPVLRHHPDLGPAHRPAPGRRLAVRPVPDPPLPSPPGLPAEH